jgi:TP901 family phage tail tape measure protein
MIGMAVAIAGGIGLSVKSFMDFDQAIMNAVSVMSDGKQNMQALRDTALSLGKELPYSATQIAKAFYYMGSAGWKATEAIQAMRTAGMLATATQYDLEKTTRYLMQTLNQFGMGVEDIGRVANIMMAGIKNSQLQIETLGTALENVGPVAHAVGISIEEVTAHLMALHNAGIRGQKAGRHLRIIYSRLINPIGRGAKVLKELGLTMDDVSLESHDLMDALDSLKKAGIDAAGVFSLVQQRAGGSALAMMNNAEKIQEFLILLKDKNALLDTFTIQMEGLRMKFQMFLVALMGVGVKLGAAFDKPLRIALTAMTKLANFLGERGPLFYGITAFIGVLAALNLAILGVRFVFMGLLTQSQMTIAMFKGLILATFGLVAAETTLAKAQAIRAVTQSILAKGMATNFAIARQNAYMTVNMMGVNKALAKHNLVLASRTRNVGMAFLMAAKWILIVFAAIGLVLGAITLYRVLSRKWNEDLKETINYYIQHNVFLAAMRTSLSALKKIFDKLSPAVKEAVPHWKDLLDAFISSLPVVGGLYLLIKKLYGLIKNTQIADKVKDEAEGFGKAWKEEADGVRTELLTLMNDITKGMTDIAGGVWDKLQLKFPKGELEDDVDELFKGIDGTVKKSGDNIKDYFDGVARFSRAVISDLRGEWEDEQNKMNAYKENLRETWAATIMDLIKGAKTWEDVWNEILDRSLENFINGFLNEMLRSWGHTVAKMIFQAEAFQSGLGTSTSGLLGGDGGGGWGSILSGVLGMFSGGSGGSTIPIQSGGGGFAKGGIAGKHGPESITVGEEGPEAIIPLSKMGNMDSQEITIVNIVDPSFVLASIRKDPRVIINLINQDVLEAGSTRKTLRRSL